MTINYPIHNQSRLLIKKGDFIDFNDPIYTSETNEEITINIAQELDIKPENIFHYLKKLVGEKVEKNEVLAEKSGFFTHKKIYASHSGIIKEINHEKGTIILSFLSEKTQTLTSALRGEVEKIEKDNLLIKVKNLHQYQARESQNNFGGETFYLENFSYTYSQVANKIIVCQKIDSYNLTKIFVLNAKGIVCLEKLEEEKNINFAYFKNENDFKKVIDKKLPYCTVLSFSGTIYFYS